MLIILPEQSLANVNAQNPIFKQYLDLINKDINDNTMLAYTDGSALKRTQDPQVQEYKSKFRDTNPFRSN